MCVCVSVYEGSQCEAKVKNYHSRENEESAGKGNEEGEALLGKWDSSQEESKKCCPFKKKGKLKLERAYFVRNQTKILA